jgi:hypothetical protein
MEGTPTFYCLLLVKPRAFQPGRRRGFSGEEEDGALELIPEL